MVKNAYLVLGYACNQLCACCPCSKTQQKRGFLSLSEIDESIRQIISANIDEVTISGGEPTLHPHFLQVVEKLLKLNIAVHILSNGEKFYDSEFSNKFIQLLQYGTVSITTTFHSSLSYEHETQNRTGGSFDRSLNGLKKISDAGVDISIKHCLTRHNFSKIKEFLQFFSGFFSRKIEIQIWGVDFDGLTKEVAEDFYVPFLEIKSHLESALKWFDEADNDIILNINNIPLCACDPYWWKYFSPPMRERTFGVSADGAEFKEFKYNYGTASSVCRFCVVSHICRGAYLSVFEYFGDKAVSIPNYFKLYEYIKTEYPSYCASSVGKFALSPYNEYRLSSNGLLIKNRLSGVEYCLRLNEEGMTIFFDNFSCGLAENEVKEFLGKYSDKAKANDILEELMYCGVVE